MANEGTTAGRKAETIATTIAGTVYRKRVFLGQRFLAICQSEEDYERGRPPLVTAWRTQEEAERMDDEYRRSGCEFHTWARAEVVA